MDQPPSSTPSGFPAETPQDNLAEGPAQGPGQGKFEMVFRFWGGNGRSAETGENGAMHAPGHYPGVLALIEDAVTSKRGALVSSREYLYISRLRRPADALVVSRQVQLGLEGYRARHGSGPVAVSIAIDAGGGERAEAKEPAAQGQEPPQVEPPHDLVTLLKLSKPAQILLTHDLCEQVTAIKGLPLRSFPARFGVYEYLWTGEEKLDLLQSEPQLTLAAMPAATRAAKEKSGAERNGAEVAAGVPAETRTHEAAAVPAAAEAPAKRGVPRAYIFGGAGLAAVAVLAVIGISLARKPAAKPAQSSAPVQVTAPAVNATPLAGPAPAAPTGPAPTAPAAAVPVPPVAEKRHGAAAKTAAAKSVANAAAQEAKTPATPNADCTLGADTARYEGLGEEARGRGDYATAVRIFREVLACDPNNTAAKEGLVKAEQAQQQSQ